MTQQKPTGTLMIKTSAMPKNTNANGDIFGGWLLSLMDQAAGIQARKKAGSRVTTVAIDKMVFHLPVKVGETIACYTSIMQTGRTSMAIKVEAWKNNPLTPETLKVTEGIFTFVAIDDSGKPIPVE